MSTLEPDLIILNGVPPSLTLLRYLWKLSHIRLCADGGANFTIKQGFHPDMILGDMDSIHQNKLALLKNTKIINKANQNKTDAEKAIEHLIRKGSKEVHFCGCFGRRFDHTLYHLHLLKKFSDNFSKMIFWNETEKIYLAKNQVKISGEIGDRISFFSLDKKISIIEAHGLLYNLTNMTLELGEMSSISNQFQNKEIQLKTNNEEILVCQEHKYGQPIK